MDNFPANSHRSRAEASEPKKERAEKPEKPEIKKVVTGEPIRRKKPLGKKFSETFLGGDAKGVAGYVFHDVLIPAAKDMVTEAVSQGIERMLFGEVRSRRGSSSPSARSGYTSYNRVAPQSSTIRRDREPESRREISRRGRATHDIDEVILGTRTEAVEVLDQMIMILSKYDVVTVAELYEMVNIKAEFTDERYGWDDLRGASVERIRGGYLLNLPAPVEIS